MASLSAERTGQPEIRKSPGGFPVRPNMARPRGSCAVSERTGIEVPQSDYSDPATVDACVSYLEARVDGGEAAG